MKKIILLLLLLKSTFVLSQTIDFDPTFGNNGKTHTGFGSSDAKAYVVVTQPDGKIIVGGSAYSANPKNLFNVVSLTFLCTVFLISDAISLQSEGVTFLIPTL